MDIVDPSDLTEHEAGASVSDQPHSPDCRGIGDDIECARFTPRSFRRPRAAPRRPAL